MITHLPDEIIAAILENKNISVEDIVNLKSMCKKLQHLTFSTKFWKKKFFQRYDFKYFLIKFFIFISYLIDSHRSMNFRENNSQKIMLKLLHYYLINLYCVCCFIVYIEFLMLHFNTIVVKDQNLIKPKF